MAWPARAAMYTGIVLGVALAVGVGGFSSPAVAQTDNGTAAGNQTAAGNSSFGAQVASFMQSTAVETNGTVSQGMWNVSVTETANPDAAVQARARRLNTQLTALTNRSERLSTSASAGPGQVAYTARASALHARLVHLQESIDETSAVARQTGADTAALDDLRGLAGNASGPEIAPTARNLTTAGQGPPDWVQRPNGERGPQDGGPPTGAETGPGRDDADGGPPDGAGDGGPAEDRGGGDSSADDRAGGTAGDDAGGESAPGDGGPSGDGDSASDDDSRSADGGDGGPAADDSGSSGSDSAGSGSGSDNAGSGSGSDNAGSGGAGGPP